MIEIFDTFERIKNTPSSLEKGDILIDSHARDTFGFFKKILIYALDPYKQFGVKKIPTFKENDNDFRYAKNLKHTYYSMFELLDKLLNGLSGNKAIEQIEVFMKCVHKDDYEIFRRIISKDLRCGVSVKSVNHCFPKLISTFDPMAAYLYDPKKAVYPCISSIKIDGMRCVAFIKNNRPGSLSASPSDVTFYTRGGKEIETMDVVSEELIKLYPSGYVIDGEVVTDGKFEDAMSILRRKKENAKEGNIYFYVFDVLTVEEWENQKCTVKLRDRIKDRFHKKDNDLIKIVPNEIVNNEEEAFACYEKYMSLGYEGSILKNLDAFYEFKRSNNWLKIKAEETLDLPIVGWYEGKKFTKNEGKLGGWIVDYKGKEVRVGGGFKEKVTDTNSENQRDLFWREKENMLGYLIEVKFMSETKDGSLRHPRFCRVRSHKGEKI